MPDAGRYQADHHGAGSGLDLCGWIYKWKEPCHAKGLYKSNILLCNWRKPPLSLGEAVRHLPVLCLPANIFVPHLLTSGLGSWCREMWLLLTFCSVELTTGCVNRQSVFSVILPEGMLTLQSVWPQVLLFSHCDKVAWPHWDSDFLHVKWEEL